MQRLVRTRTGIAFAGWLLVGSTLISGIRAESPRASLLEEAESRLRAIYERNEFRAKRFQADWLPDSTGYTVSEPVSDGKDPVLVRYDAASGERSVLEPSRKDMPGRTGNLSPDGRSVLVSTRGNLYVREVDSGREIRLTNSPADSPVSNDRAVWSPDGKWIAFVQSDASAVRLRSVLVPGDPTYPEVKEVRYARVGGAIPMLRVGVVDAQGKETRWLSIPIPAEGFYLGQVEWAGNSHELCVEKLSRFRNEREFLLADVRIGAIRRIFRESDPAWVVASYGTNAGLTWIRDGQAFLVLSEKDGWRHAYVYSREGRELALLTPGAYDIIERAVVDEAGGWFYFYASPDNATQKYLYRVRLDGTAEPERVTPADQPGTHDYVFSPDAKWAFHTYSTFDTPPVTELVQLPEHRLVRVLEDNQELRERMKPLIAQPTEFFQLEIGEGVVMDAWMIKPGSFDPARKYPVFVHVYGEPHAQTVLDAWGKVHADYHRLVADLGYLVVSIDNRGTPAPKGAAWRRAIFGSLGPLSTEEQAAGVKELGRTRPYVDLSRVGIWGWSGGGSNTLNAMFRKPDVYHVGIAVAPKPQPHLYNAWFQEIYMETPETNPEGYRRSAPINFADGLQGDLLIVHGTGETNTHLQITEGLVDRLIELGKPFDYMAYPHRDHGLREGRGTAVHLRMLMTRYLIEHLAPGAR
ncbi:MAG: DPP IV N-terminal domain-containing protein [Pirellulaceae bacterium]|nr:DPP IV N-terminal domain-containing protein [Pirellulaceae bacterium]